MMTETLALPDHRGGGCGTVAAGANQKLLWGFSDQVRDKIVAKRTV